MIVIPQENDVIEFHRYILERYGGRAGYNNYNLLPSALYSVSYYCTIIESISALFYSLVENHIWQDGNKRTACTTILSMIIDNNCKLNCTNDELKELAEETAKGNLTKNNVLNFFYKRLEFNEPHYIYAIIYDDSIRIRNDKKEIKQIKEEIQVEGIEYKIYRVEEKEWLKNKKPEDSDWWKKNGNRLQRLVVK